MEAFQSNPLPKAWPISTFSCAQKAMAQLGDFQTILAKSRLRLAFELIMTNTLKGSATDMGKLKSLLIEVQSFNEENCDFMHGIVQSFFFQLKTHCESIYVPILEQQLKPFEAIPLDINSLSNYQHKDQFKLTLNQVLQQLASIFQQAQSIIEVIEKSFPSLGCLGSRFQQEFKKQIIQNLKLDFRSIIKAFFSKSYIDYEEKIIDRLVKMREPMLNEEEELEEQDINILTFDYDLEHVGISQRSQTLPQEYQGDLHGLQKVSDILVEFGWPEYIEFAFTFILNSQVDAKLEHIKGNYEHPVLGKLTKYLDMIVKTWIQAVLINNTTSQKESAKRAKCALSQKWNSSMELYLLSSFAKLRTNEMFEIFSEFPDSSPCLNDLKYALDKTKLHNLLATQMKQQFQQRLLLPGVSTLLIIEHYIQAIRAMKLIDPSTILLEVISEPIKEHLRKRQDTLRCIVQSIIAEDSELYEQLGQQYTRIPLRPKDNKGGEKRDSKAQEESDDEAYISSDEDEAAAENWEPLPLNQNMLDFFISAKRKKSDIISTLVNIYGSQDAFLKVYKSMLEERLLSGQKFSYETEVKNLELMKIRFGEQNLHACDVMLKDIKESERINQAVKKSIQTQKQQNQRVQFGGSQLLELHKLQACIISKGYWQQVQDEEMTNTFQLPAFLKKTYDDFAKYYSSYKRLRAINFRPNLGSVMVTLHFNNGSFKFKVAPIQASIVSLFDDKKCKSLTAEYIAKELDVSVDEVRRKISFWVCKGVLKETRVFKQIGTSHYRSSALLSNSDVEIIYTSADKLELKGEHADQTYFEESDLMQEGIQEEIINIKNSQMEDDRKLVQSFIMNILNNPIGGSTLEKIYSLLKNVYKVKQNITVDQTKDVLHQMMMDSKLSFNGTLYTLHN